ncbi:hypothetical protein [Xylanimonas ulmi]|uniref:Uncharacterized protein n=1 Tax=Xylanimonas ulmi TaxID=228973 RepID=A0A4Q7M5L2_9MICO|nr:hypothetical protein [Xylanibacterium ulmi]RZS62731.1 hypothetical protein EV386_3078 [Xylanibacterium ulmi]
MTRPQDERFVERLRHATAEAPPSGLHLDEVLRSARGKARRARAVTGIAVAAAVALAGAGAWRVVPSDRSSGPADGVTGEVCAPDDVDVRFGPVTSAPVVTAVARLTESDDGQRTEDVAPYDPSVSGVRLEVAASPAGLRAAILAAARAASSPLEGFAGAEAPRPDSASAGIAITSPLDGTHLVWRAGERHEVRGTATCGERSEAFVLRYTTEDDVALVRCADGAPSSWAFGPQVVAAWCPVDELPEADRAALERAQAERAAAAAERQRMLELGVIAP